MPTSIAILALAIGSWTHIAGGTWDPTPLIAADAKAAIRPYVVQQAGLQQLRLSSWSSYSFQYQGKTVSGHRFLYINAYCIAPPAYAAKQLVQVLDGGPCFFSVLYDPRTKSFTGIIFNGEA